MSTRELIHQEVESAQQEDLDELYQLVHRFLAARNGVSREQGVLATLERQEPTEADQHQNCAPKKQSLMSKLREIQFDGPEDFSENLHLYLSGEKKLELKKDTD